MLIDELEFGPMLILEDCLLDEGPECSPPEDTEPFPVKVKVSPLVVSVVIKSDELTVVVPLYTRDPEKVIFFLVTLNLITYYCTHRFN